MEPTAHPLFFASSTCPDFKGFKAANDRLTELSRKVLSAQIAAVADNTELTISDDDATHDIKTRVHRNLKEKTKFDAGKWLAENQGAYRLFKQFTLQAIESGVTRLGAKAVAERIRWESNLRKTTDYKLNNSAVSEMARRFMADYPEYAGIFSTRKHQ